jgi:hypothetical protein
MKKMLAVLAVVLVASGAMAQIDPDPDGFGIYFDTDGLSYELATTASFQPVTAYLLLTRPSDTTGVSGWECTVDVVGPGALAVPVASSWVLSAGTDVDDTPEGFQVGIGTGGAALPYGQTVVLATFSNFVFAPGMLVEFFISNIPGTQSFNDTPGYAAGSDETALIPAQVSSGYPYSNACAVINGAGVVADEPMSWSGVKNLFQ